MGKYSHLKTKIPALTPEDQFKSSAEKINIRVLELLELHQGEITPATMASLYISLKEEKAELEREVSRLEIELEAHKRVVIDAFESEGIEAVRLTIGKNVFYNAEPHSIIRSQEKLRAWAKEHDMERLLVLPWQTVNAMTKDYLLKGENPPDGVEAYMKDKLMVRKA